METTQQEIQKARNAQVGLLMKTYRQTFVGEDGARGLTQEELLRRMADVSPDYAERYSHATVSRWEAGKTRPTIHRLGVLGAALNLEPPDIAGMVLLAGLAPSFDIAMECVASGYGPATADPVTPPDVERSRGKPKIPWIVVRFLLLAVGIAAFGYALAWVGWDERWMPVVYVGFALALVLSQHFVLPRVGGNLCHLFWVSLFVVTTTPLLHFSPLGMDHYNIYFLADFAGTHYPYMLALLLNLALALVGAMLFRVPWRWRYSDESASRNALRQAAWMVVPPIGLVYAVSVVISNIWVSIQLAVLMPVVAVVFIVLLALRDPQINPSEQDRRFLTTSSMLVATVTTTLGIVAILAIFLSPDLPGVLPDHNLFRSWEIDFTALGYTKEEALRRVNLGYVWHAACLLVYMVFVLGAYLLWSIYGVGEAVTRPTRHGSQAKSQAV